MVKRSNEPLPWFLFGAGGFLTAFFLPIHILLFGIAIPLGWVSAPSRDALLGLLRNPLTRLYLGSLCILGLFHAAHRLRSTFIDTFQVKHLANALGWLFYGSALAGSIITVMLLFSVP